VRQVHTYLSTYSSSSVIPRLSASSLRHLTALYNATIAAKTPGSHSAAAGAYLFAAANISRSQWTQFRIPYAVAGIFAIGITSIATMGAFCVALQVRQQKLIGLIAISQQIFKCMQQPLDISESYTWIIAPGLALLFVRAILFFSNSLILAEAQTTSYLATTSATLLATAAISRVASVRHCVSNLHYILPSRSSPFVAASAAITSLWTAVTTVQFTDGSISDEKTAIAEPALPALLSFWHSAAALLFCAASYFSATEYMSWFVLRVFVTTLFAILLLGHAHVIWKSCVKGTLGWQLLSIQCTTQAVLITGVYAFVAVYSCHALITFGAHNRIGANPFDKTIHNVDADEGTDSEGVRDGFIGHSVADRSHLGAVVAALLCCAMASHHLQIAALRSATLPGTVQQFGVHVPWWKHMGDIILAIHNWLGPLGLLSDTQACGFIYRYRDLLHPCCVIPRMGFCVVCLTP
jgi:hypothetical protein